MQHKCCHPILQSSLHRARLTTAVAAPGAAAAAAATIHSTLLLLAWALTPTLLLLLLLPICRAVVPPGTLRTPPHCGRCSSSDSALCLHACRQAPLQCCSHGLLCCKQLVCELPNPCLQVLKHCVHIHDTLLLLLLLLLAGVHVCPGTV
jgi:hypothetical protein